MRERNALVADIELADKFNSLEEEIELYREFLSEGEDVTTDLIKTLKNYYALIAETELPENTISPMLY